MKREHVAVLILLLILVLALATVGLGQLQPATISLDGGAGGDRDGQAAGRHLDLAELDAACLDPGPPPVITPDPSSVCTVSVEDTDAAAWEVPLVGRWLPRESRRLDLELVPTEPLGVCVMTLDVESGPATFEVDLDTTARDEESASISIDPAGAVLVVPPGPGCVLTVGRP